MFSCFLRLQCICPKIALWREEIQLENAWVTHSHNTETQTVRKKKKRNREYIKIILPTALPPLFFCLFVSKVKQNDYSQENVDEIGGIFPPI